VDSSVTEHVFPSIIKLTTNGTGNCVVVGFLVTFLIIGTAEFFSAHVAGIGLRILDVGFHVSSEIALHRKLFPTIVTHVLLKRKNRNPCCLDKNCSCIFIPVLRFDCLFVCVMHIFSGMTISLH
jgi:hypothetical protein